MSKSKYESGMKHSVIVKWVYVVFKHKNDDGNDEIAGTIHSVWWVILAKTKVPYRYLSPVPKFCNSPTINE